MFRCNARGTCAPFWPLLVHKFWNFVVDYSFYEGRLALRRGRNTNSFLGSASWERCQKPSKLSWSRVTYGEDNLNCVPSVSEFGLLDQCFPEPLALCTYVIPVGSLQILEAGWQFV